MRKLRLAETPLWLPHPDSNRGDLLYAPLARVVLELNPRGRDLVNRLYAGHSIARDTTCLPIIQQLLEAGVVTEGDRRAPTADDADNGLFAPSTVTLCLTSRCNLRCKYCYAYGGSGSRDMPWEVARSAIDTVLHNATARNADKVTIAFHGGGEPTQAMPLIRQCADYGRMASDRARVGCRLSLGTNGVVPPEDIRWIAHNIDSITLSLDGTPELQNRQRPTWSGEPSWDDVVRTLHILDEEGAAYGIRVTITQHAEGRIPEIVSRLSDIAVASRIQLEPMDNSGRGAHHGEDLPSVQGIVNGLLAAWPIARARARELEVGGTNPSQLTCQYCALCQDSMVVSERGLITACYETIHRADPRQQVFTIGEVRKGRISISQARALDLRRESLGLKTSCAECWARYSCAGDCHAKVAHLGPPSETVDDRRCYMIREVSRARILEAYGYGWPSEPSVSFKDWHNGVSA